MKRISNAGSPKADKQDFIDFVPMELNQGDISLTNHLQKKEPVGNKHAMPGKSMIKDNKGIA